LIAFDAISASPPPTHLIAALLLLRSRISVTAKLDRLRFPSSDRFGVAAPSLFGGFFVTAICCGAIENLEQKSHRSRHRPDAISPLLTKRMRPGQRCWPGRMGL